MKYFFRYSKYCLLLLLSLTFCLIYLTDHYILTAGFYEQNGDPFSVIPDHGGQIYQALQKWVYLSSAVYLLLKLCVITLILNTAFYLHDQRISFANTFKIVVMAEFVFLVPAAVKLITFNYTFENGNLLDWHRYYVLSALTFFPDIPADWYYALQSLNVFEIVYWFILAYGISKITSKNFDQALVVVLSSYVPALVIWIVSVTFFSLVMFPSTG